MLPDAILRASATLERCMSFGRGTPLRLVRRFPNSSVQAERLQCEVPHDQILLTCCVVIYS